MTKKTKEELFKRDQVETRQDEVLFSKLRWEPDVYSFRDKKALNSENEGIQQLAEDIRQTGGLLTAPLVRRIDADKFLVLDGHRRKAAIELLMKSQTPGFEIETLKIPVSLIDSDVTRLEELMRSASANVSRLDFSKTERARVLKSLYDEKCPEGEIQRILGIKKSQYDRDLLLACTDWMMDLVENKCVNFSTASRLLQVAKAMGKERELREALNDFVEKINRKLVAENKRRRANDQDEKTGDQLDPQRYLKGEQVAGWEADMKANRPLAEASFKFKALVSESKGVKTLEIGSINRNLAEMNKKQIAKVIKRLMDVVSELEPVALVKQQQERQKQVVNEGSTTSPGDARLAELGIVFDDDEEEGTDGEHAEMDEGIERDELDFIEQFAQENSEEPSNETIPDPPGAVGVESVANVVGDIAPEPDYDQLNADQEAAPDNEQLYADSLPEPDVDWREPDYEQLNADSLPEPDVDWREPQEELPPMGGEDWDESQGR